MILQLLATNTNEADVIKPVFGGTTMFACVPPSNMSHILNKQSQNIGTPFSHQLDTLPASRSESVYPAFAK
jgi:hypothetical protein